MNSRFYSELALEADGLSKNHLKIIDVFLNNPSVPISLYSNIYKIDIDSLPLTAKQQIFDSAMMAEVGEMSFWKDTAKKLEEQSFIKYTLERGYKNFPKNR